MEGITKLTGALESLLKTLSSLNNSVMLWILIASIIVTVFFSIFFFFVIKDLRSLKKSHNNVLMLHEDCLEKTKNQDRVLEQIAESNRQMAKNQEWLKGIVSRFFNEKFE